MYPRNPLRLPNDVLSRFTLRLPSSAIHLSNRSHSASFLFPGKPPVSDPSPPLYSSSPYSRIIRHRWKGRQASGIFSSTFRVLSSSPKLARLLVYFSFPFSFFLFPVFSSSTTAPRHRPHSFALLFLERKTYADARAGIFMPHDGNRKNSIVEIVPFSPTPPPFRRLFAPLLLFLSPWQTFFFFPPLRL